MTQVVALQGFYPAESYHQDYAARHPDNPYIFYNDAPKVAHLEQQFPASIGSAEGLAHSALNPEPAARAA